MKQTFKFAGHAKNLAAARAFVREFLRGAGFPERDCDLMVLGVDEACSNIIRHAYGHGPVRPIALRCERLQVVVRFTLRDYGVRADPARLQGRTLDAVQPGGLGMHFIRHAFDEIDYRPKKLGTELVLVRRR